jgi:hypothetical protein
MHRRICGIAPAPVRGDRVLGYSPEEASFVDRLGTLAKDVQQKEFGNPGFGEASEPAIEGLCGEFTLVVYRCHNRYRNQRAPAAVQAQTDRLDRSQSVIFTHSSIVVAAYTATSRRE